MKIVSICAELAPWCRTGGLGDVTSALPAALREVDPSTEHITLVPLYPQARKNLDVAGRSLTDTGHTVTAPTGEQTWTGRWWRLDATEEHRTYFLECDALFEGPGLYELGPNIAPTVTLSNRFSFFSQAAFKSARALLGGSVDLLHLHDWHVAPVAWLATQAPGTGRPKTVLTIHNLAFQGWCPITEVPEFTDALPLPDASEADENAAFLDITSNEDGRLSQPETGEVANAIREADESASPLNSVPSEDATAPNSEDSNAENEDTVAGTESQADSDDADDVPYIGFLLMGIEHADRVTTVSPQYANEIQTEAFGCGAETLLSKRGVTGILNGVDPTEWTPATDPHIAAPFSKDAPHGRAQCRQELLRLAGWPEDLDDMVFGAVTRLAHQKGLDWVAEVVPKLKSLGARLVILGTGDDDLETAFAQLANKHPNVVHALLRFDIKLSHQIYAGADAFLVPSRFEPCGLTQLYAMQYGAVPIVNPVGGLANTVFDHPKRKTAPAQNGFRMPSADSKGLLSAMRRASTVWRKNPKRWQSIVDAGYAFNSSWHQSGASYLALFGDVLGPLDDGS